MARRRTPSARRKRAQIAAFEQQSRDDQTSEPTPEDSAPGAPAAPEPKPSSGTGKGRPASAPRSASRRARADSGEPGVIACPQCGTQYRVPESAMESKLTCKNCRRSFFPKTSTRKPRHRNQAAPYIALGSVAIVAIVIGIVISNLGPSEVKLVEKAPVQQSVNTGWTNPRVQRVVEWAKAIATESDFVLNRSSDFASLQNVLGVSEDEPWGSTGGDDRANLEKAILAELKSGDRTLIFREFQPEEGELDTEAMATADHGVVLLQLPPREGTVYHEMAQEHEAKSKLGYWKGAEAQVRVAFAMAGPELKVTGWEVVKQPRKPAPKSSHKPHEKIAAPETVERKFGEATIKVTESELVPLDHLADTPPELRAEIDGLIETLMDVETVRYNRAIMRLEKIGRPAIPRLLNKMYEVKPVTKDDREGLKRVISAMTSLSGMQFGYNVADRESLLIGGTPQERTSSLKQWYAWWYKYHDQDFTSAIDKEDDESLFLTEEEKAALKKSAEGESQETRKK